MIRYLTLIFCILTLTLWLIGCGSESPEEPPEDSTAPLPPNIHLNDPNISDDEWGPDAMTESNGIYIEWDANDEDDIAGYKVYRSMDSNSGYKHTATLYKDELFYEDRDVQIETRYYYRITAFDESGHESRMSQITSYTLLHKATLTEPANQAVITNPSPEFRWLEVNAAEAYVVRVFVNTETKEEPWQEVWRSHEVFPYDEFMVRYNDDGLATQSLEDGKQYRWRVDANSGPAVGSESNWYHFQVDL